mgnify:FL=1
MSTNFRRGRSHTIEFWGDMALFSQPDVTERFSYAFPTPSAIRGMGESICWKGRLGVFFQPTKLEVKNPVQYFGYRRNEVKSKVAATRIKQGRDASIIIEENRTQRQSRVLLDPHYRVTGHYVTRHADTNLIALDAQLERRALKGSCFRQPFFGCKEFIAFFKYIPGEERNTPFALPGLHVPPLTMVYDIFDLSKDNPPLGSSRKDSKPYISVFTAFLTDGVMQIPEYQDQTVLKVGGFHG